MSYPPHGTPPPPQPHGQPGQLPPGPPNQPRKSNATKIALIVVGGVVVLCLGMAAIGALLPDTEPQPPTTPAAAAAPVDPVVEFDGVPTITPAVEETTESPAPAATTEPAPPVVKPTRTRTAKPISLEKQNAVRSAESYLRFSAFSRKGLIRQLSSDAGEGFSKDAATYAVDSLKINFNEQAARSAKKYLEFSAFSRKGLIQQLESDAGEGFTHAQAVYGVDKAGL